MTSMKLLLIDISNSPYKYNGRNRKIKSKVDVQMKEAAFE